MKTLFALFVAITLTSAASARIGETEEECIKRYGAPVSPPARAKKDTIYFEKNQFQIQCGFRESMCWSISYVQDGKFEIDVIKGLLASNGGSESWEPKGTAGDHWLSKSYEAVIFTVGSQSMLIITDNRAADAAKERVKGL